MGFQFLHIEAYARHGSKQHGQPRKWSAREIAAEAMREPDACPTWPSPCRPRCCTAAPGRGREAGPRLGRQQPGRQGAQAARRWPRPGGWGGVPARGQRQDWPRFREATVAWLRQQYGERLRSVVEHTDGRTPICTSTPCLCRGSGSVLHPGRQAAAEKARQRGQKGAQNAAYKQAMGGWQDGFQRAVAAHFGLTRRGPGKRRLTRGAWKAEQEQARSLAQPVPAELAITPQDVAKRVTKAGLLGKQYESREELAARLTELVQERARPLAAQAARAEFDGAQASRLVQRVQVLEAPTTRSGQSWQNGRRRSCAGSWKPSGARRRRLTSWPSCTAAAGIRRLTSCAPFSRSGATAWSADSRGLAVRLDELEGLSKRLGPEVERCGWSMCSKNRSAGRGALPCRPRAGSPVSAAGRTPDRAHRGPFGPAAAPSVSVAQRGQMFSGSRCASGW